MRIQEDIKARLTLQKEQGNELKNRLKTSSNLEEIKNLNIDFKKWDIENQNILKNAFTQPQIHVSYSGIVYLGNINVDPNSFQGVRDEINYCLPKKLIQLGDALEFARTADFRELLPIGDMSSNSSPITKPSTTIIHSNSKMKLFISHSSKDAEIITYLVDLLSGIGIKDEKIIFTSSPEYGLPLGGNFLENLKTHLNSDPVVLFILSESFYESPICMCEMGAVWIRATAHIPILIPPFDFKELRGVFQHSNGLNINDKNQLNVLKTTLEEKFNIYPIIPISTWERKRDDYLIKINNLII